MSFEKIVYVKTKLVIVAENEEDLENENLDNIAYNIDYDFKYKRDGVKIIETEIVDFNCGCQEY